MQKIRIDFDNPGLPQHISAVENDSQSRFFQATLYENGKAYTAPEGATYSIMYRGFGPQNQGWYDTINDGAGKRAACAVAGNVVTCEIARQALQVPGHVSIVLCVTTGKGYMLKSWPIECDCKNDRYDSTAEIQSFFYVTQISNESWTQAIQAVEELKNTIDPTLSVSGKAADAAKVGEAVNAESERAKGVESQLKEELYLNPFKNLFGGTFENARIINGVFTKLSTNKDYAASDYYVPVVGGNNYTVSLEGTDKYIYLYVHQYNSNKEFISSFDRFSTLGTGRVSKTYNVDYNARYIRIDIYRENEDYMSLVPINLQIEVGTTATEYYPHGKGKLRITDNGTHESRISKLENEVSNINELNYVQSPNIFGLNFINGEITDEGTITSLSTGKNKAAANGRVAVNGGELYTIQFVSPEVPTTIYLNQFDDKNSKISEKTWFTGDNAKITETLSILKQTKYVTLSTYRENESWENIIPQFVQIEKGSVATEYRVYGSKYAIIPEINKRIDKLENSNIPSYYGTYLKDKISTIENILRESYAHGDAFYFITDMHWDKNAQKSPDIITMMQKRLRINKMFTGGDITSNGYANSPITELRKAMGNDASVYSVSGNHEYIGDATYNEIAYMQNSLYPDNVEFGSIEKSYYYVDNKAKKIRYIVLAAYGEAVNGAAKTLYTDINQLEWFKNTALNVDSGWTIIIFTHCLYAVPVYSDGSSGNVIEQPDQDNHGFTNAIKNYNGAGVIACVIQGHLHYDRIFMQDGMPPVVCVTCDKNQPWIDNGVNREPELTERSSGSIKEQAFDVVVIDTNVKKLKFIRIGCPANNGINIEIGSPVEIREVKY